MNLYLIDLLAQYLIMSVYYTHIKNQKDKTFLKIMDYGFAMYEELDKINQLNNEILAINWKSNSLSQELKYCSPELKPNIILEIQNIGKCKHTIKQQIDAKLYLIDSYDGYRAKISRLGCDPVLSKFDTNCKGFIDYVLTNCICNNEFINNFKAMVNINLDYPYVSSYAQKYCLDVLQDNQNIEFA